MEHLQHKQKILIMLAVMSALLFSALNMTIVGTALPKIVSEIGGMEYYDWVFTIYMLTSSITAILVGKLSDIYGRKLFILVGIVVFSLGSLLSGFSETITQLIFYRGIQGFGGGMLMSVSFATVGDLFSPRERGKWQGAMGGVFGIASVLGPTLGGYIVDYFKWSWIFWVFLPFGVVAFFLIGKLYPKAKRKEKESIDYLGSLLLSTVIVTLLLGFSWADNKYEWNSPEIIGLFAASFLSLVLFLYVEKKVKSPVIPLYLFKNSVFSISNIVSFLLGAGMFSVFIYMPFHLQGVAGISATKSGSFQMIMTLSLVLASAVSGNLITKTGKYKRNALIGLAIMAFGIYLNTTLTPDSSLSRVVLHLVLAGLGMGMAMPVFNLTVQNAVSHKYLGVATATSQLFREIGGTVGVAIMGSVMGKIVKEELTTGTTDTAGSLPVHLEKIKDPQILMDKEVLASIRQGTPEPMQDVFDGFVLMLREALSHGLSGVFMVGAIALVIAFFFTIFLKEIPLRTSNKEEKTEIESQI